MRIVALHSDNDIVQVEPTPPVGVSTVVNGKYLFEVPEGTTVEVNEASYILNGLGDVDAGSIITEGYENLLRLFPSTDFVRFNPLITADHVAELDLTASFNDGTDTHVSRAQAGRGTVGSTGNAANSVAMLAQNDTTTPPRPGVLITDTIDISAETLGLGADAFRVWWRIYRMETSHDVNTVYSVGSSGINSPALRRVTEIEQEPPELQVFLSNDDGVTYTQCTKLGEVAFCDKGTSVRVAFKNTGSDKLYIAGYAILF